MGDTKRGTPDKILNRFPGTGGDEAPDVEGHGIRRPGGGELLPTTDDSVGRGRVIPQPKDDEPDVEGHSMPSPPKGNPHGD